MAHTPPSDPAPRTAAPLSRRRALTGAAALGLASPVLAACGSEEPSTTADPATTTAPASPSATGPVAATADVPVGGGLILEDEGVVLTQPTEGDVLGFSNICTHQNCPVSRVEEGAIVCTCHGSRFSIEDGSVQAGPAPDPLPVVEVSVEGGEVSLA